MLHTNQPAMRSHRINRTGLGACAAACLSGAALAQAPDAPSRAELGEIVVTAQKVSQNLQTVPVAVTAITAEDLVANRITNLTDVANLAPGVDISNTSVGGLGGPTINIRGVVSSFAGPTNDPANALYVDGVYLGRSEMQGLNTLDITRVEVLRGPQGVLYGKNSTGGAINFITEPPSGRFGFKQEVGVGNYEALRIRSRLDLPEWNGFSVRLNYMRDRKGGYVDNLGGGTVWHVANSLGRDIVSPDKLGGSRFDDYQVKVRYAPGSRFSLDYKLQHTEGYEVNKAAQVLDDSGIQFLPFIGVQFGPKYVVSPTRLGAVNNELTTPSFRNLTGHSLIGTWNISDQFDIKNILAYFKSVQGHNGSELTGAGGLLTDASTVCNIVFPDCSPAEGSPFKLVGVTGTRQSRQFQEELQLNYRSALADVTAGAFFFRERTGDAADGGFVYVFQTLPDPVKVVGNVACGSAIPPYTDLCPSPAPASTTNKSKALYAHAAWHVSDKVDIQTGVRQTWDDRSGLDLVLNTYTPFSRSISTLDWLAGVTVRPTDRVMLWAKASTAFLAGGRAGGLNFEPEKITQFELGAKTDLLDKRLRLNASVFYSNDRNQQFSFFDPNTGAGQFLNAGKSKIYGAELELTAIPVDGLKVGLNVGYVKYKVDSIFLPAAGDSYPFTQPFVDVAKANCTPPGAPPDPRCPYVVAQRPSVTGSVSSQYDFRPFANGSYVSLRLDGQYRSSSENRNADLGKGTNGIDLNALTRTDSSFLLNARASLLDVPLAGGRVSVAAWGRNLTNVSRVYGNSIVVTLGIFTEPRTYGADLTYDF